MTRTSLLCTFVLFFCISLSYSQTLTWIEHIGGSDTCNKVFTVRCMTVDKNSRIYLSGMLSCDTDMDPGSGATFLHADGDSCAYIQKLTASRELMWAKVLNSSDYIDISDMTTDDTGNLLITGTFRGSVDFDLDPFAEYILNPTQLNNHVYTAKYDSLGNFKWVTSTESFLSYGIFGRSIKLDANNNIYIGGHFGGEAHFNGTTVFETLYSSMVTYDAFIEKMTPAGDHLWARSLGAGFLDSLCSLGIDKAGYLYCVGTYQGVVDIDPGPGNTTFGGTGNGDAFIVKMDGDANVIWAKHLESISTASVVSRLSNLKLNIDTADNLLICGAFNGFVDFNPSPAALDTTILQAGSLTPGEIGSAFVLKLDQNGNLIWVNQVNGAAHAYDIKTDAFLNVYVTGAYAWAGGADFDPGPAEYYIPPIGGDDPKGYMQKLTPDGHLAWVAGIGCPATGFIRPQCIQLLDTNDIVIGGHFIGTGDFAPDTATVYLTDNMNVHGFIARYKYGWPAIVTPGSVEDVTAHTSIYPNPTTGTLNISSRIAMDKITVSDILGRCVYSLQPGKAYEILKLDQPGLYLVTITIGGRSFSYKVMVNN